MSHAPFFLVAIFFIVLVFLLGFLQGRLREKKHWKTVELPARLKQSKAVLQGNFSEQLSPYLPNFPFSPNDCYFLGRPIDFMVFKDLETDKAEVVFVEVKSGKHKRLSPREQALKKAIEQKKVSWYQYNVPLV